MELTIEIRSAIVVIEGAKWGIRKFKVILYRSRPKCSLLMDWSGTNGLIKARTWLKLVVHVLELL